MCLISLERNASEILFFSLVTGAEKSEGKEGKNGIRAIKISPDGQNLASGDRMGNIRYFSFFVFALFLQLCFI